VFGRHVTLISSEPRVYLLKEGDLVGLSASPSEEFPKWTVLIGRAGLDNIPSIPDPTLRSKQEMGVQSALDDEAMTLHIHGGDPLPFRDLSLFLSQLVGRSLIIKLPTRVNSRKVTNLQTAIDHLRSYAKNVRQALSSGAAHRVPRQRQKRDMARGKAVNIETFLG
jgi:hypothetical protein